jgi:hypothetical protein
MWNETSETLYSRSRAIFQRSGKFSTARVVTFEGVEKQPVCQMGGPTRVVGMELELELEATKNERRTHPSVNIDGKKAWSSWTEPRLWRDPPAAAWRRKRCDFSAPAHQDQAPARHGGSAKLQAVSIYYCFGFGNRRRRKITPFGPRLGIVNRPAIIGIEDGEFSPQIKENLIPRFRRKTIIIKKKKKIILREIKKKKKALLFDN